MNKNGQFGVGMIVMIAIAIIVAVIIIQASADNMSVLTTKNSVVNQSVTAPAAGSTSAILTGQAVSGVTVINGTSGTVIPASNYTITNYVVSNGQLVSTFTTNAGPYGFAGKSINVSYTYEPFGYDTNTGGRAVANLIILFAALAIAIVVLVPVVKEKIFDFI